MLTDAGVMIGTGLLYQSGEMLALAGPISLLVAYILMGTVVYAVQVCPRWHRY